MIEQSDVDVFSHTSRMTGLLFKKWIVKTESSHRATDIKS